MSRNLGCSCLPPRQSEWRAPGMLGMVDQLIYMTCTVEPFEDVRKRVPGVRHPKCVRLSRNLVLPAIAHPKLSACRLPISNRVTNFLDRYFILPDRRWTD